MKIRLTTIRIMIVSITLNVLSIHLFEIPLKIVATLLFRLYKFYAGCSAKLFA